MSNLQNDFTVPGTSVSRQRSATIVGGLRMEAGCWTKIASTSFCMPTDLQTVISVVCASVQPKTTPPCVSAGYLAAPTDSSFGDVCNYIAIGF